MRLIHISIKRICKRICAGGAFRVKYSRGWQRLSSAVYYESQNKRVIDNEVVDGEGEEINGSSLEGVVGL